MRCFVGVFHRYLCELGGLGESGGRVVPFERSSDRFAMHFCVWRMPTSQSHERARALGGVVVDSRLAVSTWKHRSRRDDERTVGNGIPEPDPSMTQTAKHTQSLDFDRRVGCAGGCETPGRSCRLTDNWDATALHIEQNGGRHGGFHGDGMSRWRVQPGCWSDWKAGCVDDDNLRAGNDSLEQNCHWLTVLPTQGVDRNQCAVFDQAQALARDRDVDSTARSGGAYASRPPWSVRTMSSVTEAKMGIMRNSGSPPSSVGVQGQTVTIAAAGDPSAWHEKSAKLSKRPLVRAWNAWRCCSVMSVMAATPDRSAPRSTSCRQWKVSRWAAMSPAPDVAVGTRGRGRGDSTVL